jgi:hypothetical protein
VALTEQLEQLARLAETTTLAGRPVPPGALDVRLAEKELPCSSWWSSSTT